MPEPVTAHTCKIRAAHVPHGECPGTAPEFPSERIIRPEPERVECARCGGHDFAVYYDSQAMGMHVECAACGTVLGGIR